MSDYRPDTIPRLQPGVRIPAAGWNRMADAIEAMGRAPGLRRDGAGVRAIGPSSGRPGATTGLMPMYVNQVFDDYLVCRFYNSAATDACPGVPFYVAKPYAIRRTPFDGQTITNDAGVAVTYAYADGNNRTATPAGGSAQKQTVTPAYNPASADASYPGDLILAAADAGAGPNLFAADGTPIQLMDINDGGRIFLGTIVTGLFQVQVQKDGGADGTQTAQATWTYSVRQPASPFTVLGANMTPVKKRPAVGSVTAQTTWGIGWAFYDASDGGAFALWDANEVEGTGGCQ